MTVILPLLFLSFFTDPATPERLSFAWQNVSLENAVADVAEAGGFDLVYTPTWMNDVRIACDCRGRSPDRMLAALLEEASLALRKVEDGRLVIVPKPAEDLINLTGSVINNQGPIRGAVVALAGANRVTVSGDDGSFSFPRLPRKAWQLRISAPGFVSADTAYRPDANEGDLVVLLTRQPFLSEHLTVAQSFEEEARQVEIGNSRRGTPEAIMRQGTTSGDLFKGLEALSGVEAGFAEGGVSIRGAAPSENLVRLDGIKLYQLDHAMGHFSAINPDAIDSVTVFKGAFPARYGDRTAGVLDIETKGDRLGVTEIRAGIDRDMAHATALVPIGTQAALMLSARKSHSDTTTAAVSERLFATTFNDFQSDFEEDDGVDVSRGFRFEDQTVRLTWRPTFDDTITITGFRGRDFTDENIQFDLFDVNDNIDYYLKNGEWGNEGSSIRWSHIGISGSETRLEITRSRFDSRFNVEEMPYEELESALERFYYLGEPLELPELELVTRTSFLHEDTFDLSYRFQPDLNQSLTMGVFFNETSFGYSELFDFTEEDGEGWPTEQSGLFVEHEWFGPNGLETLIGFRGGNNSATDTDFIEPRFAAAYPLGSFGKLRFSAARAHQFVLRLPDTLNFFEGTPSWFLAIDEYIEPGLSRNFQLGYNHRQNDWLFDIEVYRRKTEGSLIKSFDPLINRFEFGQTADRSTGAELRVEREFGPWLGSLTYAYQRSNVYRDITNNEPLDYPTDRNRPHTAHLALTWRDGPWSATSIWRASSGRPTDIPDTVFVRNEEGELELELSEPDQKNNDRLPGIFRWDFRVFRTIPIGRARAQIGISVTNITDHSNITDRVYIFEDDEGTIAPIDIQDFGRRFSTDLQIRF